MNVTADMTADLDHTFQGIGSAISQLFNGDGFGMSNTSNDSGSDTALARNGYSAKFDSSTITKIVINTVVNVICVVTIAIHIPLLMVLKKCNKMSVSLKLLLSNLMACNIVYFSFVLVTSVAVIIINDMYFTVIYNVRSNVAMAVYSTSSCTTVGLAIERLVIMLKPFDHVKILTKRNSIIYIASSWSYGFLIPIIVYLYDLFIECEMVIMMCGLSNALNINRGIFACTFTCILLVTVGAYIKIRKVVKKQMNVFRTTSPKSQTSQISTSTRFTNISYVPEPSCSQTNNRDTPLRKNFYVATQNILKIIITNTVSYILIIITCVIFLLFPEWISAITATQLLNFISTACSAYISLYFYIWKSKECQKRLFLLCCSCSSIIKERANQMVI